ncbi:outer membrane protein TolC [Larkinella arboricola]|uniref:Outer membrane protein TolC n=1 Tax=Larkinella arboricola TaxID=643671 RepID=A0A327X7T9_LARAB|nr:TolC family protein [Larkinella arboricola]RAK03067.1 outer membrane protein TolC [Larkinella arboricola]
MKPLSMFLFGLLLMPLARAQSVITLEQCYSSGIANDPLTRQREILQQTGELALANLDKNRRLPQLGINGQASWQSEVTKLPIELPGVPIPQLSKDQYKLTADLSYTLYDGQQTVFQKQVQQASTAVSLQQIAVEQNRLKEQINAYFLNILLTDENTRLTRIRLEELQNRVAKAEAGVRYGTVATIGVDVLRTEVLTTEQQLGQLGSNRRGLRDQLGILTGLVITDSTRLIIEEGKTVVANLPLNRPEQKLFDAQRTLLDEQLRLTANRLQPRLRAFAQGGAGRPALNFLNNDFRGFFIGGLRLSWDLSAAYTLRNDRTVLALSREQITVQQKVFDRNLALQLRQQQTEIDRISALLEKDREISALRSKVRQTASVQLDNGTLSARDYTTELNAESQALLNQKTHELQLLLAKVQYRTLTGN